MFADIIVDLQYGDCGKGKITHALCKSSIMLDNRGVKLHQIRFSSSPHSI